MKLLFWPAFVLAAFLMVFPGRAAQAAADTTSGAGPTAPITVLTASNTAGAMLTISENRGRQTVMVKGYSAVPERKYQSDVYRVVIRMSEARGASGILVGFFTTMGSSVAMNFPAAAYLPQRGETIRVDIQIGQRGPNGEGFYEDVARPASVSFLTVN